MYKYIKYLFLSCIFFLFWILFLFNNTTYADWINQVQNAWWIWTYEEKLYDMKNVFQEDLVSSEKIIQNKADILSLLRKWFLVWWPQYKNLILDAIVTNSVYHVTWWNVYTINEWTYIPLFNKNDSENNKNNKVLSLNDSDLSWIIKNEYLDIYKSNIKEMLWIEDEYLTNLSMFPKIYKKWQVWYVTVSDSRIYSINKVWELIESSEISDYLIPVKINWGLLLISLKWEDNIKKYTDYKTEEEKLTATNNYMIYWKIQIDKWLFDYCKNVYFNWSDSQTLSMFENKTFELCDLLENDFDWDSVNELILVNYDYKISHIYNQTNLWENYIVRPIFKSNQYIFKLLHNSSNIFSSFLLTDFNSVWSFKNILDNGLYFTWNFTNDKFSQIDLITKFSSLNNDKMFSLKQIHSKGNLWYNQYKINWFYTHKWTWSLSEWWIALSWTAWQPGIYLNNQKIWLWNTYFLSDNPTNYIYFNKTDVWLWLTDTYIDIQKSVNAVNININWKTYLTLLSDWTYSSDYLQYVKTWWNLVSLFNQLNWITSIWLISYATWNINDYNSVYDLQFSVSTSPNLYVYWISNNGTNKYFQLKQILNFNWFNFNFENNIVLPKVKNILPVKWFNYDDQYWSLESKNQYIFDKESLQNTTLFVWYSIHSRSISYYSQNNLYFQYLKEIYFDWDDIQERYIMNNDTSYEDVQIEWFNFWKNYKFLNNCAYEDVINNNLSSCAYNLTWFDVDNDWWDEWIYNDWYIVQVYNNIIFDNWDWSYWINFSLIFNDNWTYYCTRFPALISYYKQNWALCSSDTVWWSCITNHWLVFYDNNWDYYLYTVKWTNKDNKKYEISDTDNDFWLVCE